MDAVCGVNVNELTEALASGSAHQLLIIDCRSFIAFNKGHIVESVNINCPPILKRRSGGFIALENIVPCEGKRSQLVNGYFPRVLVYDDNTQDLGQASRDSNLLSVIQSLLKQVDRLTVTFIIGGFDAVQQECPVLCMNQEVKLSHLLRDKFTQKDRESPSQTVPAEILPHLYLGDVSHSSQRPLLDHLGITAMLNVSSSCENFFQSHFRYMNIQVNDNMDADLLSCFPKVIEFIDSVARQKGKVLVHCRAGVSRSATVCIAYLMQTQGLSLDSAFEFVVSRRPIIDPNLNFIQQLQKFEASLRSQLNPMTTALTCSQQARSAPPVPATPKLPNLFTFFPEAFNPRLHQDMDASSLPTSPEDSHHHHLHQQLVTSCQNLSPACHVSVSTVMPTCHLSQTVTTPHPALPVLSLAPRPVSLPLLQVSTPLSPARPRKTEAALGSSYLSLSGQQPTVQVSPLLNIFHEPSDGSGSFLDHYVHGTRPPMSGHTFSFLGSEIVTCQALSVSSDLASSRQYRPTMSSALDASSAAYLGSKHSFATVSGPHSFATVSGPHSPLSPLGVPLSPLPSCG